MTAENMPSRKAPRDPEKKRSCIYVMLDQKIQGTERAGRVFTSEIYLDGRLRGKAEIVGNVHDEKILALLESWDGFKQLVHSVGVSISGDGSGEAVKFSLLVRGKNEGLSGPRFDLECAVDGAERTFDIPGDDESCGEKSDQFRFEFAGPDRSANATVKLYLNDGFEVPEIPTDPPIQWDSREYRALVESSLLNPGNAARLQRAVEKAKNGEAVTVAFIGGSITQGAGAVPINTECYARRVYEGFVKRYCANPQNCRYIKAGIGGTSSELGLLRYDRQVEEDGKIQPDIVTVEFAVNDLGDETEGVCHESLIYHILSKPWKPAVIMLFSVFADDWNLQERLAPVGKAYNLPMVSLSDALVRQFGAEPGNGRVMSKRQYFYDIFHPSNDGHRIMADCMLNLIEKAAAAAPQEDEDISAQPAIGRSFAGTKLYDRSDFDESGALKPGHGESKAAVVVGGFGKTDTELQCVERDMSVVPVPQFEKNWMHTPGGGELVIKAHCKSFFLIVKDTADRSFGRAEISADGRSVKVYDPLEAGWTHCNAVLVIDEAKAKEHEVFVKMAAGDEDRRFTVLAFAVN